MLGLPAGSILAMSATGEMALSVGYHHRSWMQPIGTLARASLAGGGVRPLQKDVVAADWSPDGKAMAVIRFRAADGASSTRRASRCSRPTVGSTAAACHPTARAWHSRTTRARAKARPTPAWWIAMAA